MKEETHKARRRTCLWLSQLWTHHFSLVASTSSVVQLCSIRSAKKDDVKIWFYQTSWKKSNYQREKFGKASFMLLMRLLWSTRLVKPNFPCFALLATQHHSFSFRNTINSLNRKINNPKSSIKVAKQSYYFVITTLSKFLFNCTLNVKNSLRFSLRKMLIKFHDRNKITAQSISTLENF